MKVNASENAVTIRADLKAKKQSAASKQQSVGHTTVKKKLSLQEQMLQDAMMAGASGSATLQSGHASSSLLDCNINDNGGNVFNKISNIVRQKKHSADKDDDFTLPSNNSNRVVELD